MDILGRLGLSARAVLRACRDVFEKVRSRAQRRKIPSFESIKWLSSRRIRQQYFIDQFEADSELFNEEFANAIDGKREDAEKQFLKVAFVQITITGFMLLALMKAFASFSFLGISSSDVFKLRDFLLFCQAATVSWSIVLQQHHHKLEDTIVAWVQVHVKSTDAIPPILLRYLGPLETFNVNVLPYKQHQFHNLATKNIFRVYGVLRFLSAAAFAAFTTITPLAVAVSLCREPTNGWFSYAAVAYWFVVMLLAITSMAINVIGVPYTDYSYTMKLEALQRSDPNAHRIVMAEIARTGKRVEF